MTLGRQAKGDGMWSLVLWLEAGHDASFHLSFLGAISHGRLASGYRGMLDMAKHAWCVLHYRWLALLILGS